jgi:hypothetical protein
MASYRRDPLYRPRVEDFIPSTPARSIAQGLSAGLLKGVESGYEDYAQRRRAIDNFALKSILEKLEKSNVYELTPGEDTIPTLRQFVTTDNRINMPALLTSIQTGSPEFRSKIINELHTIDMPDKTIPEIVTSYINKIADREWKTAVAEPEKVDAEELLPRLQPLEDMLRDRVAQQPLVQSIGSDDEAKKTSQSFLEQFLSAEAEPDAAQLLLQQPTEMVPLLQEAARQKREELTNRLNSTPDTHKLDEDIAGLDARLRNVSIQVPPIQPKKRQLTPGEIREYLEEYTSTGKMPAKFNRIVIEPMPGIAGAKSARIYQVTPDGNITDIGPSPTGSHIYKVPLMVRTPEGTYTPKKDKDGNPVYVSSTKPEPEYKTEELSADEQYKRALEREMETQLSNTILGQMVQRDKEQHDVNITVVRTVKELRDAVSDVTDDEWESLRHYISTNLANESLPGIFRALGNIASSRLNITKLPANLGRALAKFGRYAGKVTRMYERGVLTDADLKRYVANPKDFSRADYLALIDDDLNDAVKNARSFLDSRETIYIPLKKYIIRDADGNAIKDADGNYISYDQVILKQWAKELDDVTGKRNDHTDTQSTGTKQSVGTSAPAPTEKKQKPRIK